jgi:small-conductance mechanosensitive channel
MDIKQIAKDTTKTLVSYLTYQAVRIVSAQLSETDPPRAMRFQQFSTRDKLQDGEAYLHALFKEDQATAFRILTVREHIAEQIADYLPEMLRSSVQQANMQQRKEQLERMTQLNLTTPESTPEQSTNSDESCS